MKETIKRLLRENLITEKLADIDADVDMLYDKYFRTSVERINETGYISRGMFPENETNTVILKTPECIEAHKLNMCMILVNSDGYRNGYRPNQRQILISANGDAANYVISEFDGDLMAAVRSLDGRNSANLLADFSEARIKGSIHHELAHWIDDTMNNKHLSKALTMAKEFGTGALQKKPINATKIELQGQIHNIKQLYNRNQVRWDTLTFDDIFRMSPPLNTINNQLQGDVRKQWLKELKMRMHREGLLGKNMINTY